AFLLDADQFRDQTFSASFASGLQTSLQVALHRPNAGNQAEEADHASEAGEAVRPGDEPGPVGTWQTQQLADDRQRQLPRIPLNQIGWTSICEQLGRKLVGNCENFRLHFENGAATKGFVEDIAQTRMVRLAPGQHADGWWGKTTGH